MSRAGSVSANPAVGEAADLIVDAGGTVMLSEITEMVGAERVLARRGKTDQIRQDLLRLIKRYEIDLSMSKDDDSRVFITPGNIEGGLTTIEEKLAASIRRAAARSRRLSATGRYPARRASSSWIRLVTTSRP